MPAGMRLVALLKSKNVYLLYWLPFVAAAIVGLRFWMGAEIVPGEGRGVLSVAFMAASGEGFGEKVAGIVLLLFLDFFVFWVANKYQFLGQQTALPALVYLLLAAGTVCRYGMSDYLLAAACVTGAIGRLQVAIADSMRNAPLFDFGVLVTLAVLLCPKLVMLLPWAMLTLPFSGRVVFKDFMAFLVGVLTVGVLAGGYYFCEGRLAALPDIFVGNLLDGGNFWAIYPGKVWAFVLLGVLLLFTLGGTWPKSSTTVISQRRGMYSLILLLFFVGSSLFFVPFNSQEVLLVVFLPFAYLLVRYFITLRRNWAVCVCFFLLVAASFWLVF